MTRIYIAYLVKELREQRIQLLLIVTLIPATFAIIGTAVCFNHLFSNLTMPSMISALSCIFLGMLTGAGGGVLRDAIMGDTPFAFKRHSNYVSSAAWGATTFYFLMFYNNTLAVVISMAITLILREIISPYGIYKRKKTNSKN